MCSRPCWLCWALLAASAIEITFAPAEKRPLGVFFCFTKDDCVQFGGKIADKEIIPPPYPMNLRLLITAIALLLAGCDIPGMGPDPRIAQREADAKAIGSACRHGLRSIEDCFTLYEAASKADIFTGWKDMDQYMRENKIEGIRATADQTEPVEAVLENNRSKADSKEKTSETEPKSTHKAGDKSTAKPAKKAAAP